MDRLELIMYNVGHGLAISLIEYPEKYVTQIDLGSGDFSPLQYLSDTRRLRTDWLYITHPHADHLSDIQKAQIHYPNNIQFIDYDWDDVERREKPEQRWILHEFYKLARLTSRGDYGGKADLKYYYWGPEKAKRMFGESNYINNSSLFIIYTWGEFKISICGDLETEALEQLISDLKVKNDAKNSDILVASHHGHLKGYTSKWPLILGKPYFTLISVQSRDSYVANGYSSPDFARGILVGGTRRYRFTTRDGNIVVGMWYEDSKPRWSIVNE